MVAAMGPGYQKYIWWKKYLTTLQMVQFVLIMSHQFQLFFTECDYPRSFMIWIGLHGVLFLGLFSDFYKAKYVDKSKIVGETKVHRMARRRPACVCRYSRTNRRHGKMASRRTRPSTTKNTTVVTATARTTVTLPITTQRRSSLRTFFWCFVTSRTTIIGTEQKHLNMYTHTHTHKILFNCTVQSRVLDVSSRILQRFHVDRSGCLFLFFFLSLFPSLFRIFATRSMAYARE